VEINNKKIIIGSDHGGYKLKTEIYDNLKTLGYDIVDLGCYAMTSCDYPEIAAAVAKEVIKTGQKGILVCGTGIGMSIAANKYDGIRAALCNDVYSAKMSRKHNDANILCLGQRVTGNGLALEIVENWLNTEFEGGRHQRRIDMIR